MFYKFQNTKQTYYYSCFFYALVIYVQYVYVLRRGVWKHMAHIKFEWSNIFLMQRNNVFFVPKGH